MITIISDPKVRQYELTFLLQASLTSAEVKKILESIAELVAKHEMTIDSQHDWGKKELAYTIKFGAKRQTEALYHHWVLTGPALTVPSLEKDLNLSLSLLRYLLVVADSQASAPAKTTSVSTAAKSTSATATAAKVPAKKATPRKKTATAAKTKSASTVVAKQGKE